MRQNCELEEQFQEPRWIAQKQLICSTGMLESVQADRSKQLLMAPSDHELESNRLFGREPLADTLNKFKQLIQYTIKDPMQIGQ